MKKLLGIMAVLALLVAPAFAGEIVVNNTGQVAVSGTIDKYAEVDTTTADIVFTETEMDAKATGWIAAVDTAAFQIQGNAQLTIGSDNGTLMKIAGTSPLITLPTRYSSNFAGGDWRTAGMATWYPAMASGTWTPPSLPVRPDAIAFQLKAGPVYTVTIMGEVLRSGLADPAGVYTDTITLTLTALGG